VNLLPPIDLAWQHQQAGRLNEAETICRQLLTQDPNHAPALHLLGVIAKLTGNDDAALELLGRCVAVAPNDGFAQSNLGNLFRDKGRFELALAAYRRAIALQPDFAAAFYNMGMCHWQMNQDDQAIANLRQAIQLSPGMTSAWFGLATVLKEAGQIDPSIAACKKAIELNPNAAGYHYALADAHELKSPPEHERAIAAYRRAIQLDPNYADARCDLAVALAALGRGAESEAALTDAAAHGAKPALVALTRGRILQRAGQSEKAIEFLRRAAQLDPDSWRAWFNLGNVLRETGRFSEAAQCVPRILARRPNSSHAYGLLSSLGADLDPSEISRLSESLDDPQLSNADRAALGFALGKFLDKSGRFDEAFAHFSRANAAARELRRAAGERYSSEQFSRHIDDLIALTTPDFFNRWHNTGVRSDLPVFIVGMPRSGTTLIEQIAASHPEVFGAGELNDISTLAAKLNFPHCAPDKIAQSAQHHLDRLRSLAPSASRVIDKMPANVEHLSLIAALFPEARIIFSRRDRRDTCLSCYFQPFLEGNLFAFDLADCGRHHAQIDRLIEHWKSVLPLRMLEVPYETLVQDPEPQSRRIIEFLGVPWDPACLEFHRTQRPIHTASAWQVRQPLYRQSIGRWRNYEKHLGALSEALGFSLSPGTPG
jgi:tetratricopeptide (TPR) repeat protein